MMSRRPHRWLRWVVVSVACHGFVPVVRADLNEVRSGVTGVESEANQLSVDSLRTEGRRSSTYVEERLTDGELFYRLKDYVRAAIIFTDIVENYPNHRAAGDAQFLLGESLFHAGDYYGARSHYEQVIARANEPGFSPHVSRSLGRLIEIATRTREFEGVDAYFAQLKRLPPQEVEAATAYYKAKFLYNRAVATEDLLREGLDEPGKLVDMSGLQEARGAFEAVAENSPYYAQARYFVGVILTLEGQYPAAVEAFRRVLRAPAMTEEAQKVIELAQIALGRLYYETDQLDQAIEAYQSISRNSTYFDVALYELAWVYIRMGDAMRAERALEVLMVAVPDSRYHADAEILRGNLLLREGRLPDAREVFASAIATYKPIREDLDRVIAEHEDPVLYFRELVRQNIDTFDASTIVPPEAFKYAEKEADIDRALRVLSDLNQARTLVRETSDIIVRLNAAIMASNRVNVFSDLRRQRQRTTSLRNRVARLRSDLVELEARRTPTSDSELNDLRQQRRQVERALADMPTDADDFAVRDEEMLGGFRALQKELSAMEVQVMGLEARIVATERFLEETAGQQRDPEGNEAVRAELVTQREAVDQYRAQIREHALALEAGKVQVGVGDARYQRDDELRQQYNELVARERELMAARGLRADPEVDSLYRRLDGVEQTLEQRDQAIDAVVNERISRMRVVLEEESVKIDGYREQLATLEEESEEVVGAVAYNSFAAVRNRFYDLVLEADVGQIDVAWAQREEHRMRVESLSRERAREINALDDEFREIMDESNGGEQ